MFWVFSPLLGFVQNGNSMMKPFIASVATLCVSLCACEVVEVVETSTAEQHGMTLQGMTLQGMTLQGMTLQGMTLQGFRFDAATLDGASLMNLRVEQGELVAERGNVTLRGTALAGVRLQAQVQDPGATPPATTFVTYRIAAVELEDSMHDPTQTGSTYLYTLEQQIDNGNSWQPACPVDSDGRRVAIPLAATWDERGDRVESSSLFTLGCSTGVIAKCYRWGYRPWLTGYGADMAEMHWTCTRLARADYCGDGVPHTQDGTQINIWDNLPAPGPIQEHGGLLPPFGMVFEAGWSTGGAVCVSHARWDVLQDLLVGMCPDRLIPPGLGGVACDTALEALLFHPSVRMFNESYLEL
jgi:hypothetical protein